jgi:2-polyprenyl-6-methoxyphenol hydroxylase-like FAD-dependent oxidoreductase
MTQTRTALVIGGGIAGPVAAMALQRAGIQATVYEAHPRSAEGIGIFLTLASNGIDALRTIDADRPPRWRPASRPQGFSCAAPPARIWAWPAPACRRRTAPPAIR